MPKYPLIKEDFDSEPWQKLVRKYAPNFKHLRIIKNGNIDISGHIFLEAETPDGRYLHSWESSNKEDLPDFEKTLKDWSPNGS
jgi:hypothetical protein